jgi:hypothetical protein
MYLSTCSAGLNTICAARWHRQLAAGLPATTCSTRTTYIPAWPTQMTCRRTKVPQERAPAPTTASQRPRLLQNPSSYAFHCRYDTSQRSVYYAGNKHHLNNNMCVFCREKFNVSFCHVPFNEAQCKQLLGTVHGQWLGVRDRSLETTNCYQRKIGRH